MRVVVTETFAKHPTVLAMLRAAVPEVDVCLWPEADVPQFADLLVSFKIPAELPRLPQGLKAIFCYGAGIDNIVSDPRVPADLPIMRLLDPGQADRMLDYAAAAASSRLVRLDDYRALQVQGVWAAEPLPVASQAGLKVTVLGLGQIGGRVASGLAALGYEVHGWSLTARALAGISCHAGRAGLGAAVDGADVLIDVLPADGQLSGLIDSALLQRLSPGALVVNIGRGDHVDLEALRAALTSHLSGAWLDVVPEEPPAPGHWLWSHPKVLLTPHIAGTPTPEGGGRSLADAVMALRDATALPGLVRAPRPVEAIL